MSTPYIWTLMLSLLCLQLIIGLAVVRSRDVFNATMLSGGFSLMGASLFMVLDAADVAFTEAAVGAGISTALILGALSLRSKVPAGAKRPPLIPGFVIAFLIFAALNSMHLVPEVVMKPADTLSRAALVTAVAAVGMKTSFRELRSVGKVSVGLIVAQTIGLALFVLAFVVL